MLHTNKKAISEIVGYALLIVIALVMAGLVYTFLKVYIPKATAECTEDINLFVKDYYCSASRLNLNITNKGLFKADAAYIRLGSPASKIKKQVNAYNINLYNSTGGIGLNPGEIFSTPVYNLESIIEGPGTYELEVQPAVVINNRIILCDKAIITQTIECTA